MRQYEKTIIKKYWDNLDSCLNFNWIKILNNFWLYGDFIDIFFPHIKSWWKYDSKIIKWMDGMFWFEWSYFYNNWKTEILVKQWDIVIDAWAFVWWFSKTCAYYWAKVYAFEPTKTIFKLLLKETSIDEKITPINLWLWDKKGYVWFDEIDWINNKVNKNSKDNIIELTTIDDFVKENNIKKIDFIKADIEWYERNMLNGAKNVLISFEPILSICTYHNPEDPALLEKIIKDINPKYKIIHMKNKLYAYT